MKKILMVLAIMVMSVLAFGQSDCDIQPFNTYHDNGELRLVAKADCNGLLHGSFTEYYDDGSIMGYGEYEHGLRKGKWIVFDKYNPGVIWITMHNDVGQRVYASKTDDEGFVEERTYNPAPPAAGTPNLVDSSRK